MKYVYKAGDRKEFTRVVRSADTATFGSGQVHPVYSTFALVRDAEWTCRLFVLEMKEEDEEGIGTFITVKHHAPALMEESVNFAVEVESIKRNEIICKYKAAIGKRLVATGRQGQKILKKAKIKKLFESLKHG